MNQDNRSGVSAGRIEQHGEGTGPMDENMLEERAREIAIIEGRSAAEVNETDRKRARLELRDETLLVSDDQEHRVNRVASSNPADVGVDTGHEIAPGRPMDEQSLSEMQVTEGIREAEHERMLQSRRQSNAADEEQR